MLIFSVYTYYKAIICLKLIKCDEQEAKHPPPSERDTQGLLHLDQLSFNKGNNRKTFSPMIQNTLAFCIQHLSFLSY